MKVIYLLGAMRNPRIPELAVTLRGELGFDVFDDWHSPGPEADEKWQAYEATRGRTYREALAGYHAEHVYKLDKHHLDRCHAGVLVLPAGRSAHMELGYLIGCGKPVFVYFDKEPERYDIMYKLAASLCFTEQELKDTLCQMFPQPSPSVGNGMAASIGQHV